MPRGQPFDQWVPVIGGSTSEQDWQAYNKVSRRQVAVDCATIVIGTLKKWSDSADPDNATLWADYDTQMSGKTASAVWYPILMHPTDFADNNELWTQFTNFNTILRSRTSAPLYLTRRAGFEEDPPCPGVDAAGIAGIDYVVTRAVVEGYAYEGIRLPVSDQLDPANHCHFLSGKSRNIQGASTLFIDDVWPYAFRFDVDAENWVFNAGGGTGLTGTRSAADDSTKDGSGGCLETRRSGQNLTDGTPYWEWTGTWADLGIPKGAYVTGASLDYDWICSEYTTGASSTRGGATLRSADGVTTRGNFSGGAAFSATSSWATQSSLPALVLNEPSSTGVRLRINALPKTGNSPSAAVTLRFDWILITLSFIESNFRRPRLAPF